MASGRVLRGVLRSRRCVKLSENAPWAGGGALEQQRVISDAPQHSYTQIALLGGVGELAAVRH